MVGLGTLINTATVLIGGTVGIAMGDRIPDRVRLIVVQVIGMVTIGLGLSDLLKTHNMVFPLLGMVFGAVIGEVVGVIVAVPAELSAAVASAAAIGDATLAVSS